MKTCIKCAVNRDCSLFGKDASRNDGLLVYCKECMKAYNVNLRKKHNTKRTEYNRAYRIANRERHLEWERANYMSRRTERIGQAKSWREKRCGTIQMLHLAARIRAKNRGMEYSLTPLLIEVFLAARNDRGALTNIPFVYDADGSRRTRPFAPSLDRIDCSKGYTVDNVRLVCVIVNISLNDFGTDLFDQMCLARAKVLNDAQA